jgi:hypothetical protein
VRKTKLSVCGTSGVPGNVGNNHGKIGNWRRKLHIGDMYIEINESRTTEFDKTGFNNTKMVTDNCDQKSIMKN